MGINHGFLNREEYLPTALRAWSFLSTVSLQKNGHIGYVQPIGERAIPGQVVNEDATAPFGVGAFLLAASEMYRLLDK
jgi:unsaturated rhamnogalacturonyl hydrolase